MFTTEVVSLFSPVLVYLAMLLTKLSSNTTKSSKILQHTSGNPNNSHATWLYVREASEGMCHTSMSCWYVSSTWLRMLGVSFTKSLIASMWLKETSRMSLGRGQRSTWYLKAMVIKS